MISTGSIGGGTRHFVHIMIPNIGVPRAYIGRYILESWLESPSL